MIGTLPMRDLAPLDYRYALDAAMTHLGDRVPAVRCAVPALEREVWQRLAGAEQSTDAGLWVEPLRDMWQHDLDHFAGKLPAGVPLMVIASQPLARVIGERRTWNIQPLGMQVAGMQRLRRELEQHGFAITQHYGIHTLTSMVLHAVSHRAARAGRPDLGDRLHFAARWRYCARQHGTSWATVALLLARKGQA